MVTAFLVYGEVVPSQTAKITRIEWDAPRSIQNSFRYYFEDLKGKSWDPVLLKIKIDQIGKEIFQSGYLTSVVHSELKGTVDQVIVLLKIDVGERTSFDFVGNKIFSRQELQSKLMDKIKNNFGKIDPNTMRVFINEEYENAGYYNSIIKSSFITGTGLDGSKVRNYFFKIREGEKIPVQKISLRGAYNLTQDELMIILKKNGTSLVQSNYYDKLFFENFSDVIKKEYLRRGFPFAEVSFPHISNQEDENGLEIEYSVTERQQVRLDQIKISNISIEQESHIKALLVNKAGSPLNIIEIEKDLKNITSYLQNEGFYFASISNINANNLLVYDKSLSTAVLNIEVTTDRMVCFNDTIINGNIKTKGAVVYREIDLTNGDLITPLKLEEIKQKIAGLGLFSSIKITPYMLFDGAETKCAKTNIVIQVKEKDFGLIELAPGYRTDLGEKLSTSIIYNNFMGMNRSLSLKTQLNQRDNLVGFDEGRKQQNKKLLEYSLKASIAEPYLFYGLMNTQVELELSSSWQRKRFYGFDADIFRFSPQISKNFSKYVSSSIKYQFERINQFDATLAKDNDNFSIGGITFTSSLDLRDDPVNSRKGPYFSLSTEWATPSFGSMKTNDLEVNFIKVISRNKYYYPINDFTLAFSLGVGMEKNLAKNGYIPSIKVFRLDGYDEIRGFDDGEINHLANGQAIGDVIVDKSAYFTAFKFEPRYNINDFIQLDVFFDAGRVYVNSYKPLDLRTSVGAGVKFLTAVGALEFSYGVKLHKETYSSGKLDSTGRFHLSIGYF